MREGGNFFGAIVVDEYHYPQAQKVHSLTRLSEYSPKLLSLEHHGDFPFSNMNVLATLTIRLAATISYFLHTHKVKKCDHVILSANHLIELTFDLNKK